MKSVYLVIAGLVVGGLLVIAGIVVADQLSGDDSDKSRQTWAEYCAALPGWNNPNSPNYHDDLKRFECEQAYKRGDYDPADSAEHVGVPDQPDP